MTVKKFYFIISILLVSVLLVNCSNETEQAAEPGLLLGFSQIGTESAWRIGNTRDIEEAAEKNGISLMLENANQKQENQIAAIRRFIAYQVDVIAFSPIVEDGWDNVLEEAKSAGIPVILVDRDITFPTTPNKFKMLSTTTGTQINAGTYTLRIDTKEVEFKELEIQ